jgi:hypothetical protein
MGMDKSDDLNDALLIRLQAYDRAISASEVADLPESGRGPAARDRPRRIPKDSHLHHPVAGGG